MKTKNKRDDVIDAALEIISKSGFHNAPTSLIAERAQVGMGTIYRYFKSKDELIHAIYSERVNAAKGYILSNYDATKPLKERYLTLCRNLFDYMVSNPVDFAFFEQYRNSPYSLKGQTAILLDFEHRENPDNFPLLKLFSEGQEKNIVKDIQLPLLVSLTMSHIFTAVGHSVSETIKIDEEEVNQLISASWDSVSR